MYELADSIGSPVQPIGQFDYAVLSSWISLEKQNVCIDQTMYKRLRI